MTARRYSLSFLAAGLALVLAGCAKDVTTRALDAIRAEDMAFHLKFLSAPEFRGRKTPSVEQDIASKYIALTAERIGLEPLMPGGSYYQEIPVEVTSIVPAASRLRLVAASRGARLLVPGRRDGRALVRDGPGRGRDRVPGLRARGLRPRLGRWRRDRSRGQDRRHPRRDASRRASLETGREPAARRPGRRPAGTGRGRGRNDHRRGARIPFGRDGTVFRPPRAVPGPGCRQRRRAGSRACAGRDRPPSSRSRSGTGRAPPSWDAPRRIWPGCPRTCAGGSPWPRNGSPAGAWRSISPLRHGRRQTPSTSLPACRGADPVLRQEYLTICSHHDHLAVREGRVYPGSDDNISGVVGMFEIAEALLLAPPKRSVIFVWNTAEELMLLGSYYFRPALPRAGRKDQRQPQPGHDLAQRHGPPLPHRLEQAELRARRQHQGHEREARTRAIASTTPTRPPAIPTASSSAATSTPTSATASRACGSSAARPRTTIRRGMSRPRPITSRWRRSRSSSIAWPWTSATGPRS